MHHASELRTHVILLLSCVAVCHCAVVQRTDGDTPVWQQVLWHHLGHNNPDLAELAAAALQAELLDF